MTDDRADGRQDSTHTITSVQPVWFLLARPTENSDELPATIGERDVFFGDDEAMDALDLHFAWCAAQHGGFGSAVVRSAHWYLQSAMVGRRVTPGLGDVFLASTVDEPGRSRAVAGGFLTEGELIHWTPFVRAVTRYIPGTPPSPAYGLAHLGDDEVEFGQIWFSPLQSRRVYPKRIVVGDDDT